MTRRRPSGESSAAGRRPAYRHGRGSAPGDSAERLYAGPGAETRRRGPRAHPRPARIRAHGHGAAGPRRRGDDVLFRFALDGLVAAGTEGHVVPPCGGTVVACPSPSGPHSGQAYTSMLRSWAPIRPSARPALTAPLRSGVLHQTHAHPSNWARVRSRALGSSGIVVLQLGPQAVLVGGDAGGAGESGDDGPAGSVAVAQ